MAFSDFTLRSAVETFGLTQERNRDLFAAVPPLEPSDSLRAWLDEHLPVAVGVNSEFARSNLLITPVLAEVRRHVVGPLHVMPGVTFDVDRSRGLSGYCDYLINRAAEVYYLRGPVIAVVEAKREDVIGGLGQCVATTVAIREFNEKDGTPLPEVYGVVSSGTVWRFLKLADTVLTIDKPEYYIRDLGKLLGILAHIAGPDRTAARVA